MCVMHFLLVAFFGWFAVFESIFCVLSCPGSFIRHKEKLSLGICPGKLKILSHTKPPPKVTGRSKYCTLMIYKLFRCKILVGWLVYWLVETQKTRENKGSPDIKKVKKR